MAARVVLCACRRADCHWSQVSLWSLCSCARPFLSQSELSGRSCRLTSAHSTCLSLSVCLSVVSASSHSSNRDIKGILSWENMFFSK
ncbi:hypothetical protein XELAEV_18002194mg [Xenopus laevis]|nr:hypothetical protein XELAEV_18002194mg [Xenopus laevis]